MHQVNQLLMTGGITEWLNSLVTLEFSWVLLALLVAVLAALGEPLYVVLGAITAYLMLTLPDFPPIKPFTASLNSIIEETRVISDKVELLAIPFFVLAGAIMTNGAIAERLVNVARAAFGWLPGGMAISGVAACMFFAAISGSSRVTVSALGTMMYPVLIKDGYSERFSTGLLTSAGSLGILIPPSIPMIVYVIVQGQLEQGWSLPIGPDGKPAYGILAESGLDPVGALFLAGVGPGILIGVCLGLFAFVEGKRRGVPTTKFDFSKFMTALRDGFWALMLPVLILGGIYTGTFTPTKAAAVAVVYAFIVEVFIHKGLELKDIPRIFSESAVLMGVLLIIIAMALGFNRYLVKAEVPDMAVELILGWKMSPLAFLLVMNLLLLVVGCLMDIMSAILIVVPLLAPIGLELGIHPIHLAIIFIVNLEIGYLTPPLGLNLFVASTIFKKPIGEVVISVIPFTLIMLFCLGLVTYVPTVSLGPLAMMAGKSPIVGFPETVTRAEAEALLEAKADEPIGSEQSLGQINKAVSGGEAGDILLNDETVPDDALISLIDVAESISGEEMSLLLSKHAALGDEAFNALSDSLMMMEEAERQAFMKVLPTLSDEELKARIADDVLLPEGGGSGLDDGGNDEDDNEDGDAVPNGEDAPLMPTDDDK